MNKNVEEQVISNCKYNMYILYLTTLLIDNLHWVY